jgi:hypothetical protein
MEAKQVKSLVFKLLFTKNVLVELLEKTPKNKKRKVCSQCHELGHGIASLDCKINIEKNNKLKNKIKEHILSKDLLAEKNICEELQGLSKELNISFHSCQKLYYEIPSEELLNRTVDINLFLKNIKEKSIQCYECNKNLGCLQINTNRIWKGNKICDTCWCKYDDERNKMWEEISKYKPIQCKICCSIKLNQGERYHYDHINMFDKDNSIYSMINEGIDIEEIYKEIDKCQILCVRCHHIVTKLENKLGFTKMKITFNKQIKYGKKSEEEYDMMKITCQRLYEEQMLDIYEKIRMEFDSKN